MPNVSTMRRRFLDLHADGFFVIPNPFDTGSARLLEAAGAVALATTSSGFAAAHGRSDGTMSRDELVAHVRSVCGAVDVPVNVDSEICYPRDDGGVRRTIEMLADAGASGASIEDYDPEPGAVLPISRAAERVAEAAEEAHRHDILLTARAENFLHGRPDIEDTVERLSAYRDAGADVLYAPGLTAEREIARVVELGKPVNVLALPGVPPMLRLEELGVRRVSTGGALTWAAYGAFIRAAQGLLQDGSTAYLREGLTPEQRGAFRA